MPIPSAARSDSIFSSSSGSSAGPNSVTRRVRVDSTLSGQMTMGVDIPRGGSLAQGGWPRKPLTVGGSALAQCPTSPRQGGSPQMAVQTTRSAPAAPTGAGSDAVAEPEFQPYVLDDVKMKEFTPKAIIVGGVFGLLFGASTVYLALRAGLTVSASIPIAVLSISVLKKLGGSTILENNIVQTIGSAGESF